jgi:hypothetical protein
LRGFPKIYRNECSLHFVIHKFTFLPGIQSEEKVLILLIDWNLTARLFIIGRNLMSVDFIRANYFSYRIYVLPYYIHLLPCRLYDPHLTLAAQDINFHVKLTNWVSNVDNEARKKFGFAYLGAFLSGLDALSVRTQTTVSEGWHDDRTSR